MTSEAINNGRFFPYSSIEQERRLAESIISSGKRGYLSPVINKTFDVDILHPHDKERDQSWVKAKIALYCEWVVQDFNLVFEKGGKYFVRAGAKRGNRAYRKRVYNRLEPLFNNDIPEMFDHKDRSKRQATNVIFGTLTVPHEGSIRDAWAGMAYQVAKYMSRLRSNFGEIHPFYTFEAHEDGYPHVHMVLFFPNRTFPCFFNTSEGEPKWRLTSEDRAMFKVRWGTVYDRKRGEYVGKPWVSDFIALSGVNGALKYLSKYITKASKYSSKDTKEVRTLALMWATRKRAYTISRKLLKYLRDSMTALLSGMHNSKSYSFSEGCYAFFFREFNPCVLFGFVFGALGDEYYRGYLSDELKKELFIHPALLIKDGLYGSVEGRESAESRVLKYREYCRDDLWRGA